MIASLVRARLVVKANVLGNDVLQVLFSQHDEMVQALDHCGFPHRIKPCFGTFQEN
jgi:hypothetical protein